MKLKGIVPPIGTPLTFDERVDTEGLRRLVRYLLEAGVHGIFVNGTMGGFALLTDYEQVRAVEIVVDEVDRRVPVVAGISDTGTKRVIQKAKLVERLGVDYLTTLPPFYFTLTQESGTRFFREVAQAVEKPLLLYNNPYLTHFNLSIDSIVELAQEPNIVGIKETNQEVNRWTQIITALGGQEDFSILIGTELLIPVSLMLGADGVIGGAHNFAPGIAVELYKAACERNYDKAFELSERLVKLCKIFEHAEIWGAFEVALKYLGIIEKVTASPYRAATEAERESVEAILREGGLTPWKSPLADENH
jgi:4-hydroxy-tetrahydrodipicolinate synthase